MKKESTSNWKNIKLENYFDIYQPKIISKKQMSEKGKYLVFGANGYIGKYDNYNHKNSEVLITCRGATCGNINFTKPKVWITGNSMVLTPKQEFFNLINKKFIFYQLKSKNIKNKLVSGTAQPQITLQPLKRLIISLPVNKKGNIDLDQQNKIVEILEKAEKLKEKRREANELADEYLNAFFLKIINNKSFPERKLNDVCLNKGDYGSGASAIEFDSKKPRYIRITDINESGNLKKSGLVSPSKVEDKYFLNKGDLLFARTGATVGKTYLHRTHDKHLFAGYLIRFIPNKDLVSPEFLYYFTKLNQYKSWINSKMKVVAQPNINAKQYGEEILIPILPISIQNKFADEVKKVEKIKENQNESEKELNNLFNSLMQKAFKGELVA